MENVNKIKSKISNKPWLILIQNDVYNVAERLNKYDNNIFVLYNKKKNKFEIHTIDNKDGLTHCITSPYNCLDYRIINKVISGDNKKKGKLFFEDIEKHNKLIEEVENIREKNIISDMTSAMSRYVKGMAYEMNI